MGKKRTFIEALFRHGILTHLPTRARLTVLAYHRIRAAGASSEDYAFDESVFGPDEEQFDGQMAWLARHADAVSEGDVLDALAGKTKLPKRAVLITFDDGYRDNFDLALPILKARGVPGLFFIAPALIDQRRLGFWDQAAWAVKHTAVVHLRASDLLPAELALATNPHQAVRDVANWLKGARAADPDQALKELRHELKVAAPDQALEDRELMTWDQIRQLAAAGMGIGSHGLSHRVLAGLSEVEQRHELTESKARLEQRLCQDVRTIAFPSGSRGAYTKLTQALAAEAGYEGCFTYETGVNDPLKLDRDDIRRLPAGPSPGLAACAVKAPWILGDAFYG